MSKKNKKSVFWHLNNLNEPYRAQAIKNLILTEKDKLVRNQKDALKSAFVWNETIEGGEYWSLLFRYPW